MTFRGLRLDNYTDSADITPGLRLINYSNSPDITSGLKPVNMTDEGVVVMTTFTRVLVEGTVVALLPFPLTSTSCFAAPSCEMAVVLVKFPSASSERAVTSVIDTRWVVLLGPVTRSVDESSGDVARVNTSVVAAGVVVVGFLVIFVFVVVIVVATGIVAGFFIVVVFLVVVV